MSYNGSGVFVINSSGQPVVTGTTITSTAFNALTADLATGLTTAITKDGQTTPTANIPMGGFKLTGLAAGTTAGNSLRYEQVIGVYLPLAGGTVTGALNLSQGANIASATTTDIGAATGNYVVVTGTTTITGLGTITAGVMRTVEFSGALTLTHNATSLILPSAANITTAAGDVAIFVSEGSGNWRCASYQRASGLAILSADYGQAQLTYTDTTHVKLIPFNGNKLVVNGVVCTVPDAGVSYTISGLASSTLYYVYAVATTGAISSIEVSTTVPVASTTAGNKGTMIKTGDDTRSLVGMVRTDGSTLFANTTQKRFVRGWFNDAGITGTGPISSNTAIGSAPYIEIVSSARAEFLAWGNEEFLVTGSGFVYDTGGSGGTIYYTFGLDSTTVSSADGQGVTVFKNASYYSNISTCGRVVPGVGYHYLTPLGGISSAFTPFFGGGTAINYISARR